MDSHHGEPAAKRPSHAQQIQLSRKFTLLERRLLHWLINNLTADECSVIEKQLEVVNYITRMARGKEVGMYRKRLWTSRFPERFCFPNMAGRDVALATMQISVENGTPFHAYFGMPQAREQAVCPFIRRPCWQPCNGYRPEGPGCHTSGRAWVAAFQAASVLDRKPSPPGLAEGCHAFGA